LKKLIIEIKYNSILVIIDRLIKFKYILFFKELYIIKDLARIFIRNIINIYKILIKIIFNKNKLFTLKF
jgi:hypothetical protein